VVGVYFAGFQGPRSREETPASGNEALQTTNGPTSTQGGIRWPHVRALYSVPDFGGFLGVCLLSERKDPVESGQQKQVRIKRRRLPHRADLLAATRLFQSLWL
jgi:hypothetical protein